MGVLTSAVAVPVGVRVAVGVGVEVVVLVWVWVRVGTGVWDGVAVAVLGMVDSTCCFAVHDSSRRDPNPRMKMRKKPAVVLCIFISLLECSRPLYLFHLHPRTLGSILDFVPGGLDFGAQGIGVFPAFFLAGSLTVIYQFWGRFRHFGLDRFPRRQSQAQEAGNASIVPLAVPLLAGPAAFSYVMANAAWHRPADLVPVVVPILLVGLACWLTFRGASRAEREIRKSTLDLVERVGGFILAAIAVEMMATGLRNLFPILVGTA